VALTSTIHTFDIALADSDRGVYEDLSLRVARHPSETEEFLVTRVLAYCLEYEEGISFSKGGVSDADDPPIFVRDPVGRYKAWIEIGSPDSDRLHKAAKTSERVAVYTFKDPASLLRRLDGERIHRATEIPIWSPDRGILAELVALLDRRMTLHLSVAGRELYLDVGGKTFSGPLTEHRLG